MIPVEVIQTPWHFTTVPDALDHWQTIIAGLAALLAALIAVLVTVRVERGKARREVDALRKSLGVELRQQIPRALAVYISFVLRRSDEPITARTVERLSRMPAPIIYSANAGKIGLLGAEAMDVMIVYDLLETARNGAAQLMAFGTPDDIISACRPEDSRCLSEGVQVCARRSAETANRERFARRQRRGIDTTNYRAGES